jgi:nitrate/nitrite transporter NarK
MNMSGNIGAIACPISVGYLIDHIRTTGGNWDWVLYLFAGIYLACGVSWLALDPNRSAVERAPREDTSRSTQSS